MYDVTDVLKALAELKNLAVLGAKTALTTSDAVLLTGLSRSHIYRLCCYKQIPHYKSSGGKHTYFCKKELSDWMLSRRIKTDDELKSAAVAHVVTKPKRRRATV